MFKLIDRDRGYLFSSADLASVLEQRAGSVRAEVDGVEANRLLNTAPDDLVRYLVEKYSLEAPALQRDKWTVEQTETRVDVRYDRARLIDDTSSPVYVPGQRITVEVPFTGEAELFYARANTYTSAPPRAVVKDQSLFLTYEIAHDAQRDVKREIERDLGEIEKYLEWTRKQVAGFNRNLERVARDAIERRRERLLANQGRVASLGIPIKQRPGAPRTYALPDVRRKAVPALPPASSAPYQPEPVLDSQTYEHILSVLQNMAHVMEQSPSAFTRMGEEDIRQHFLVQLNGQFEGRATAETFNVSGKTDILLREQGRNVFIAECKFWKGPKRYRAAIDQLLGYAAWRDTKTAILVFNRGTSMSKVLDAVRAETASHPNCKRQLDWKHESGFRFVFHHGDDPNRELLLTVLVFDVPRDSEPESAHATPDENV